MLVWTVLRISIKEKITINTVSKHWCTKLLLNSEGEGKQGGRGERERVGGRLCVTLVQLVSRDSCIKWVAMHCYLGGRPGCCRAGKVYQTHLLQNFRFQPDYHREKQYYASKWLMSPDSAPKTKHFHRFIVFPVISLSTQLEMNSLK